MGGVVGGQNVAGYKKKYEDLHQEYKNLLEERGAKDHAVQALQSGMQETIDELEKQVEELETELDSANDKMDGTFAHAPVTCCLRYMTCGLAGQICLAEETPGLCGVGPIRPAGCDPRASGM